MTMRSWGETAVFAILLFLLLAMFADYDGYEGDDINSIMPMLTLAEARAGLIWSYKLDWQPLSYLLGGALYGLTGGTAAIFATSAASIALAAAPIYHLLRGWAGLGPVTAIAIFLTAPEIIFTGLYYSSSAPAVACVAWAAFAMWSGQTHAKALVAGALIGISALFRLDFLIVSPLLAALAYVRGGQIAQIAIMAITASTLIAVAFAAGLLDPVAAYQIYSTSTGELAAKASSAGWNSETKLRVASVILSPIGWGLALVGGLFWLAQASGAQRRHAAVVVLGATPMAAPLIDLLSVKYMMPALILWPLLAAILLAAVTRALAHEQIIRTALAAATILLVFISLDPMREAPFIHLEVGRGQHVGTHDGPRGYGGWIWHWRAIGEHEARSVTGNSAKATTETARIAAASEVRLGFLGQSNFFTNGSFAWRSLYPRLIALGFQPNVRGRGHIELAQGDRSIHLFEDEAAVLASGIDFGPCLIRLTAPAFESETPSACLH